MVAVLENEKVTSSRLNVRLSPEVKARITRAAHILGQDLTEFASITLNERADEIIAKNEDFTLSEADRQAFLDILSGDVEWKPTEKSVRLAAEYRRGTKKGQTYEFVD